MPHHTTRQDSSDSCDVPSSSNNSFIPFYMRDDLPTNRQSKARVNQRRRRKTVQDVLQQKVPNNSASNSVNTVAAGPTIINQLSSTTNSNAPNNNLNSSSGGSFLSSLQHASMHQQTPLAPKPIPNNNYQQLIPPNILPKSMIPLQTHYQQAPSISNSNQNNTGFSNINKQINQQHVPILPKQQHQQPSISPLQQHQQPQQPLPFPPSPLTYQHYQQQQQYALPMNQQQTVQGIFPAQTFTEITTKFGGSVQYRNRKSFASSDSPSDHHHEQKQNQTTLSDDQQHALIDVDYERRRNEALLNRQQQQQQQHRGIISTSAASSNIESSIVIIGENRIQNSLTNSRNEKSEEMSIDSTPTQKVYTPRVTSDNLVKKENGEGKKTLSISSFLSAQQSAATASSASSSRAPTSPRSNYINGVKTVSTAAVHKLKRLQQQIRSSDKDLHAINSSAQVLNYLKLVQQQQQAYIQQRMMLQSSSVPSLNISVNHIKNQLYNPSTSSPASSSNNNQNSGNNNSQEQLPSTFIPSYQLDPTVDMMISNWENQIRQRQRQQKMQKYRRPIPNLRLPQQDYASNFSHMIDSSSSGGSSKGSHSDRSEAWMSARFASSTISSGRGTLSSGLGISPLNSPSSSCGTVSDCGMHYTADPNDLISPRIHSRQTHTLITAEQLSPEDGDNDEDDEDGDALMIDDSSPTIPSKEKVLPPISTLNLPPLNLLSISTSTTENHNQDQSKSCPNSASRENDHDQGIQTLFGSGSHKSVQPNPISLNHSNNSNPVSHNSSYRPEGFITHRSHQQHYINNYSNASSSGKQIHHQVHSTQRRVDSQHVENLIANVCPSPKRSTHQYHPYPSSSPRSKKKKVPNQDTTDLGFNFPPTSTNVNPSQSASTNAAEQVANQEEIQQRMSMQLFQAIFRHTPLPMFILNSKSKFTSVNHAFVNMLGYDQEEIFANKFASEFVFNENELMQQIHKCSHEGGLNNGMGANQQHYSLAFKDSEGLEIQAENTIYVLRDVMYAGEFFVFTVTNYQSSRIE